ncbi:STM4015 family protein [Actinomadura sp. WMMB 499]|uniref:STM4015 family protein n=1 Tax=Actinomadura sp. WMMB 499 TaxID=1219491 RepID=UPI0012483B08|nr:STM4015 family protein [Actinomadura sp. WMMB 499]QFG20968.1 leucine-rich repeat domain-containing protein [Actinomadura sp. WMMB 499]
MWEINGGYTGLPVFRFDHERLDGEAEGLAALPPAAEAAWCVASAFDEAPWDEVWKRFCESVDTTEVRALIFGYWGADYDSGVTYPVPLLVEAAASFPNLRSVFLGDIESEESEISWINHGDITPIFRAFPELECLEVRGGNGLVMEPVEHRGLRMLRFESGGLPAGVVRAVGASDLSNVEVLELWLGTENYGGDATVADLAPLLSGERLPSLRHLGLENSELQDEIAAAAAGAPVVARLETLSLAMGTLTDRGAEALLSGQPLTHLRKLDLHHHFMSKALMKRVDAALPGVDVNLDDREEPDEFDGETWFFIEVSE